MTDTLYMNLGSKSIHELPDGRTLAVTIESDDCTADSPRNWDNFGTMVCWHPDYTLGDEQPSETIAEYCETLACSLDKTLGDRLWDCRNDDTEWALVTNSDIDRLWAATEAKAEKMIVAVLEREVIFLGLHLYDHGGITMRTCPFSCPWDSGQVGFIFATKDQVRQEYGLQRVSEKAIKSAMALLQGEVDVYDQYLTGQVYGYMLTVSHPEFCTTCKNTEIVDDVSDSCWGFYGSDHIEDEVNRILDYHKIDVSITF